VLPHSIILRISHITVVPTCCSLTPEGSRGTLLFTGATASVRGNKTTSAFSAGKFALRSLSQSLAKEFGKHNIHVAHAVIDGAILTERSVKTKGEEWLKDEDRRLSPEGIAEVGFVCWFLLD